MAFKAFFERLLDRVCVLVHITLQDITAVPPALDDRRWERQDLLVAILSCQGRYANLIAHETIPDIYAAGAGRGRRSIKVGLRNLAGDEQLPFHLWRLPPSLFPDDLPAGLVRLPSDESNRLDTDTGR